MREDFRLGEWLVRPDLNSLERQGGEFTVEPRTMDVLVDFAEHPGEVLSKDRIIQVVWQDAFVTDDSLMISCWWKISADRSSGSFRENYRAVRIVTRWGSVPGGHFRAP